MRSATATASRSASPPVERTQGSSWASRPPDGCGAIASLDSERGSCGEVDESTSPRVGLRPVSRRDSVRGAVKRSHRRPQLACRGPLTTDGRGLAERGQTRLVPGGLRSERHATNRRPQLAAPRADSRLDRSAVVGASVNLEGHTVQITKAAVQRMHDPLSQFLALTRGQLSKREVVRVQLRFRLDKPMHRAQDQPRPAVRLRVRITPNP